MVLEEGTNTGWAVVEKPVRLKILSPGFNLVVYRQRSDESHRLDPFCATGQAAAPPSVYNYIKQVSNQNASVYMY